MKIKSCANCKYGGVLSINGTRSPNCGTCRDESHWEELEPLFGMHQSPIWGGEPETTCASESLNPLQVQAGGTHYKGLSIQPAEYISKNNLEWCAGNIVKYVTRHKDKGGFEDIKKARHYLDLLVAFYYPGERLNNP